MNNNFAAAGDQPFDTYARRITARLSTGEQELPHDISERLRVARQQAVAARRLAPLGQTRTATAVIGQLATAGAPARAGGSDITGWWTRLGSVVPLVVLVVGLVAISMVRTEQRANELAEVDAQILVDDLPPSAYADPGFAQFLRSGAEAAGR